MTPGKRGAVSVKYAPYAAHLVPHVYHREAANRGQRRNESQQGDDAMSDKRDPTLELQALVEQLGASDWRMALEAETALARAGQAGIEVALWGLAHPNTTVRRGGAGFMDHPGTDACFAAPQWPALHDPAPSALRAAVHSSTCQPRKP